LLLEHSLGFSSGLLLDKVDLSMIYVFDDFELDMRRAELRRGRAAVGVEPRIFSLLSLLLDNRDRVVSRDEIVDRIWDGRFISEAALSTAVHGLRRALGDDGAAPRYVKTVRGRGFRFVASVDIKGAPAEPTDTPVPSAPDADCPALTGRPGLAVLPFRLLGDPGQHPAVAEAIPAELISALSRLRWLAVVARGSTFRFRSGVAESGVVAHVLAARYCLTGLVEPLGSQIAVTVNLVDTAHDAILWGERYAGPLDGIHEVRANIVRGVVAALEAQIPVHEAAAAQTRTTEHLDAWGAYHLALRHVYRFTRADNEVASDLFARAIALDPNFARGHAGLSFASFQAAFLRYSGDIAQATTAARQHAERSVELDPLDPMANFTMGRSLWLDGMPEAGQPWLERATEVNPNFAQGFYARAWADVMAGRSRDALQNVDLAMSLSPIDPMLYAMQATRALAHLEEGDRDSAALWADRAARAPGAHYLIGAIAAAIQELDGNTEHAARWASSVKSRRSDTKVADFFRAFPFENPDLRSTFAAALARHGF
jgi:DNA-binding winged helix-turn-helix (wHTH) protein/tetratricopeptide (TPR) repeat protein